jgi:hypothetical protein
MNTLRTMVRPIHLSVRNRLAVQTNVKEPTTVRK